MSLCRTIDANESLTNSQLSELFRNDSDGEHRKPSLSYIIPPPPAPRGPAGWK